MKKHKGRYETCVQQASQFLDVAWYCKEREQGGLLPFPLFVNAALACELYLKAIMMLESGDSSFDGGHNLNDLYLKISSIARCQIESHYNNKNLYISLDDLLTKYGNNFVEWRYAFENGSVGNYKGIIGLAESLKEYVETVNR